MFCFNKLARVYDIDKVILYRQGYEKLDYLTKIVIYSITKSNFETKAMQS